MQKQNFLKNCFIKPLSNAKTTLLQKLLHKTFVQYKNKIFKIFLKINCNVKQYFLKIVIENLCAMQKQQFF